MTEEVTGSSPISKYEPTVRDHFAVMERTLPVFQDDEELAKYLEVPLDLVLRKGRRYYLPMAVAKWRYANADAMIRARRK